MKGMLTLMLLVLSTAAMAGDSWLSRTGSEPKPISPKGYTYSVPEPESLAVLGAGLVSLGIYAKKKQGKKR